MENVQLERWSGEFGQNYVNRNVDTNFSTDHAKRTKAYFESALSKMQGVKRILEVGCNTGHNFLVWSELGDFELVGIEPQTQAIRIARERQVPATIIQGSAYDIPFIDGYFDLVYTSGVLMHIPGDDLPKALREINRATNRYFLTSDYHDESEVHVPYHQHDDMLWRRDMAQTCAEVLPHMQVIYKQETEPKDDRTGKYTYGLLFEK